MPYVDGFALHGDGWFTGVRRLPSPNFDQRPGGTEIDLIVIHNISLPPGSYGNGNVERLFTNALDPSADPYFAPIANLRVSAHLFVARSGSAIQFVSCLDRAWHAGASLFDNRARCNDFSIGIELEGTDDEPYEDVQYDALSGLLPSLIDAFPIRAVRGHSDIAPGRKTDPGPGFDWARLRVPPHISLP